MTRPQRKERPKNISSSTAFGLQCQNHIMNSPIFYLTYENIAKIFVAQTFSTITDHKQ